MAQKKQSKNWLEWTVTMVSILLVLFTLGFLGYQLIYQEQTPPDIQIQLGKPELLQDYYAISVKAENRGSQTAQKVRVKISLGSSPENEDAIIQFDYLPGKSTARGWISFNQNPDGKHIKIHVLGYIVP